jgi:hypothetical protein
MNATLQLRFPLTIFEGATPLLTPLRTSCLGKTNPQGSLISNSFEVIRG